MWDHWEPIHYIETFFGKGTKIEADVAPTCLEPVFLEGEAVGTMRYKAELEANGHIFKTPGSEEIEPWGISDKVHRVSKEGNTTFPILNTAYAFCNIPFIYASESPSKRNLFDNQAEHFLGADCADFCIAVQRYSGYPSFYYTSTRNMDEQLEEIVKVDSANSDGIYFSQGKPVSSHYLIPGADIVVWDGHTGIFVRDNDPKELLNTKDSIFHILLDPPSITPLGDAYLGNFRILRNTKKPDESCRE